MINRLQHDEFFKRMMTDPRVAKDFFAAHLPNSISTLVDLETLVLDSNSFIDEQLRGKVSDMLYQVQLSNRQSAYLYLLVEHQSRPDVLMPFRLHYYVMQILEKHIRTQEPSWPLPLIFPIVFYNGKQPYTANQDIFSLFGEQEALARDIFLQPFTLVDVSTIEDETLRQHQWAGILEWCMMHVYKRDILPYLPVLGQLFQLLFVQDHDDILRPMIKYILTSMETEAKAKEFVQALSYELSASGEKDVMTIAEKLYAEGRQEGWQEGLQRGLQKGVQNTVLAIQLLQSGEPLDKIIEKTNLDLAVLKILQATIAH
jgi:predicted transposase/invertase (TIGR01784 family)